MIRRAGAGPYSAATRMVAGSEGREVHVDAALIIAQGVVVIGAILLGVRMGGIGLGLWGLVGLAILVVVVGRQQGGP